MKPVKIAILSLTHGHTRKYFQTLKDNPGLEWVAVSAESEKVKENFLKNNYHVPCYMSDEEMFKKHPDIEAVVMASANNKHIEQFRQCTKRGIHILSMKIPSFDMDEYDEMIEFVEGSGIVCQIELELHYNPVVTRIKKLLNENELGKITGFNATNITLSPVWAFPWQGVPEESYGKRIPLSPGGTRLGLLCMSIGCIAIFSLLFSIGHFLYGNFIYAVALFIVFAFSTVYLFKVWGKLFD
jgi:predicted dehydrogenase